MGGPPNLATWSPRQHRHQRPIRPRGALCPEFRHSRGVACACQKATFAPITGRHGRVDELHVRPVSGPAVEDETASCAPLAWVCAGDGRAIYNGRLVCDRPTRRTLPDASLPPPRHRVLRWERCEYFASAYLTTLAWKMAGSLSISKPNRSEASQQPQLLKKSVSEFRLNITREVRMSQLRLETPSRHGVSNRNERSAVVACSQRATAVCRPRPRIPHRHSHRTSLRLLASFSRGAMVPRGPAPPSPPTPPRPSPPLPHPTAIRAPHAPPTADQVGVSHQRVRTVSATAKAAAQAAVQEVYPSPSRETRHAIDIAASATSATAIASNKIIGPAATRPPPRATRGGAGTMRKPRQSLTIHEKLKMIEMNESGAYSTWADIKEAFPKCRVGQSRCMGST